MISLQTYIKSEILQNKLNLIKGYMWVKRLHQLSLHLCSSVKKHQYRFQFGSCMIPHPAKTHKGGQDALFLSENFLVVADGVGGWADQGIDPGIYSKRLCKIIATLVEAQKNKYIYNPKQLLIDAVKQNKEIGSTTACIASLHPETGNVAMYYIGDSVYSFVKQNGEIGVAEQQQKSFNFPYQVGSVGDDPSEGVLHEHIHEDVKDVTLILATDGLWDNLPIQNLYNLATSQVTLQEKADKIARETSVLSLDEKYESPFYKKANAARIHVGKGGKPDDITVILAKIIKKELL